MGKYKKLLGWIALGAVPSAGFFLLSDSYLAFALACLAGIAMYKASDAMMEVSDD